MVVVLKLRSGHFCLFLRFYSPCRVASLACPEMFHVNGIFQCHPAFGLQIHFRALLYPITGKTKWEKRVWASQARHPPHEGVFVLDGILSRDNMVIYSNFGGSFPLNK